MFARLSQMMRDRANRVDLYSTAAYWDGKAKDHSGSSVSMWPNPALNACYHAEQVATLSKYLGDVSGLDILDVGCGSGRMSRYLTSLGAKVSAFDFSSAAIELARAEPGADAIDYRVLSIFDLDDKEKYDLVISWGTVAIACRDEQQLEDAVRRMAAALRPGGRIALLEPVHTSFMFRVLRMSPARFGAVLERVGFEQLDIRHLHFWPARLALAFWNAPGALTRLGHNVGKLIMDGVFRGRRCGDYQLFFGVKR